MELHTVVVNDYFLAQFKDIENVRHFFLQHPYVNTLIIRIAHQFESSRFLKFLHSLPSTIIKLIFDRHVFEAIDGFGPLFLLTRYYCFLSFPEKVVIDCQFRLRTNLPIQRCLLNTSILHQFLWNHYEVERTKLWIDKVRNSDHFFFGTTHKGVCKINECPIFKMLQENP